MIPIVTTDKEGNLYTQVFNDNLAVSEQINRILLSVYTHVHTKLVNDKFGFDQKVDKAEYTDEQLETIKTAALALSTAVSTAIGDFAKVVEDPDAAADSEK